MCKHDIRNYRATLFKSITRLRDKFELPLTFKEPIMDLNYLYQRYAVSLQMARDAACGCSRIAHQKLAEGYATQIASAKLHGTAAPTK